MSAKPFKPNYKAKKSCRLAPPGSAQQQKLQYLSNDTSKIPEFVQRLQCDQSNGRVPTICQRDLDGSLASVAQGALVISDVPPSSSFQTAKAIQFTNASSAEMIRMMSEYESRYCDEKPSCSSLAKPSRATLDHIMAERKRREKLNRRFMDLSAVIPGLTKLDKATVLVDAVKYVKQLEEKLKRLQDQIPKTIFRSVKRAKELPLDCQTPQQDDPIHAQHTATPAKSHEAFPEIDIRLVDNSVLIKLHCARKKGMTEKIFAELEDLHVHVCSAQILSFPSSELDLTYMGQVEDSYNLTVDTIMQSLQALIKSFN